MHHGHHFQACGYMNNQTRCGQIRTWTRFELLPGLRAASKEPGMVVGVLSTASVDSGSGIGDSDVSAKV